MGLKGAARGASRAFADLADGPQPELRGGVVHAHTEVAVWEPAGIGEHYDGGGYPYGLKGEEIPLEARIINVADSFDAMVSERPYKKGYSITRALKELKKKAGSQFDPEVVAHFCRYMKRESSGDANLFLPVD